MRVKRLFMCSSLAVAVAGTATPSLAQIEEIVVTARKTSESLQSTPVAVTALNEIMLAQAQVTELSDLQRTTPSLSIMSGGTGSSALVFLSIRGNAQVSPSGGTDPAVATYVDGVYLARPTGGNVDMFDVSQAEVLRGPQGTLFGRNTTGGALNIKTNDPTGEFEGYVRGEVGNYDHRKVEAVVNLPIIGDELAARFAVRYNERDGFGDYRSYSDPDGFFFNGLNREASDIDKNTYARGKIKWEPADLNFDATLGFDWSEFEDRGQRTQVMGFNPDGAGGMAGLIANALGFNPSHFIAQQKFGDTYWNVDNSSVNPYPANAKLGTPGSTNEGNGIYLDVNVELGDVNLKSITAYREASSSGTVDLDGTPLQLLSFHSQWDQNQISQEFQLSGNVNDDLDWITGLYYFQEDSKDFSMNRFGGGDMLAALGVPNTVPMALGGARLSNNDAVHDNVSYGAFAQANYSFTEKLRGTLGFRYTFDKRETKIFSQDPIVQPGITTPDCKVLPQDRDDGVTCKRTQDADFEYPAWIVSLDYQATDDLFLYAKTSGASMAGGWNFRTSANPSFDPEQVKDIELGFKADLFDGMVRLNGAFFYMKASDQQRQVNIAEGLIPVTFIRNAGQSEAKGAEFELTWLPWEGMTINASLSLLDMEYKKYESDELITSGPNQGQIVRLDRSRENAPHAPETTFSIGATQTVPTALGELDLHVDYYRVDETWFQDSTVNPYEGEAVQARQREEKRWNSIPDYELINAQATLRTNGGNWELSLWGKNLTDEKHYSSIGNYWDAFGTAVRYVGDPRTFGASVRYNW
jgi:iron complex outermembrane receptor protein